MHTLTSRARPIRTCSGEGTIKSTLHVLPLYHGPVRGLDLPQALSQPSPASVCPVDPHQLGPVQTLSVRVATPEDYWASADVTCQTFFDNPHINILPWLPVSPPAWVPAWVKGALMLSKRVSSRVDCVQASLFNDSIQAAGHGRNAVILASQLPLSQPLSVTLQPCDPHISQHQEEQTQPQTQPQAEPQQQQQQFPGTLSELISQMEVFSQEDLIGLPSMPPIASSWVNTLVPPPARAKVGVSAQQLGLLGVATIDSFGDRVPARTLDADRDNAMGWKKRDGIAYVCNVAVLESARRQGVARALMEAAENLAREWGCRSVGLHCNPKNTAAWNLYRSLGYRPTPALEDPWIPYIMGRPPDRCVFLIKRVANSRLVPSTVEEQGLNHLDNNNQRTPATQTVDSDLSVVDL